MKFFLWGSSYRCIIIKYMLHPTSKPTLVLNLMDEKNAQTPPTIRLLSSHHHPGNCNRNLEPLIMLSNVSAGNPTPRVPPTLALVYVYV